MNCQFIEPVFEIYEKNEGGTIMHEILFISNVENYCVHVFVYCLHMHILMSDLKAH
jgi:hypothetical protein